MDEDNSLSYLEYLDHIQKMYDEADKKLISEMSSILQEFNMYDLVSVFTGLVTISSLQNYNLWFPNLICLTLKYSHGSNKITKSQLEEIFHKINSTSIDRDQDPPEDVFVTELLSQYGGTYKIFEGFYEGSTFYLVRFIDIIDSMPNDDEYYYLYKKSVHALLSLSNLVADRINVEVNNINIEDSNFIDSGVLDNLDTLKEITKITEEDLSTLGYDIDDLDPFILEDDMLDNIDIPSHHSFSIIDNYPLIDTGDGYYLLYANGISTAIRNTTIRKFTSTTEDRAALHKNLIGSYNKLFPKYSLLGSLPIIRGPILTENQLNDIYIQQLAIEVAPEFPLQRFFVIDNFEGDLQQWAFSNPQMISKEQLNLDEEIIAYRRKYSESSTISKGITIVIFCGWGRSLGYYGEIDKYEDWNILYLGIHDLLLLSDYPGFDALDIWRLQNIEQKFKDYSGNIFNHNGLLNLYGWIIENNGHIVPHEDLPDDIDPENNIINIPTNCQSFLRVKSRNSKSRCMIPDINNVYHYAIKYGGGSYFEQKDQYNVYSIVPNQLIDIKQLSTVCFEDSLIIWCNLINPGENDADKTIWDSTTFWIRKISKSLQNYTPDLQMCIEWNIIIINSEEELSIEEQFSSISNNNKSFTTTIKLSPNTEFLKVDNSGERAMIKSFLNCCIGTYEKLELLDLILDEIFTDSNIKICHFMQANIYNDILRDQLPKHIIIDNIDDGLQRLGLGFNDIETQKPMEITGKEDCIRYLSGIVDKLWDEIHSEIKLYNRESLCYKILINKEALKKEDMTWEKGIRSILAQYGEESLETVNNKKNEYRLTNIASRLLLEMVICTSTDDGLPFINDLLFKELLSKSLLIYRIGGWSDGVNSGLIPAHIKISAYGQIMMDYSFELSFLQPFQSQFEKNQRKQEAEEYDRFYNIQEAPEEPHDDKKDFLIAWKEEYGLSFFDTPKIVWAMEDFGIESNIIVYNIKKDSLIEFIKNKYTELDNKEIEIFINKLTLPLREKWNQSNKELPEGFKMSDWFPWVYRRKLSYIAKPIIALETCDNPNVMISPTNISDSINYLVRNTFNATLDEKFFDSKVMKKWIGKQRSNLGNEFNDIVAQKMKELGWESRSEVNIREFVSSRKSNYYGDIDVLAWSKEHNIVIAVECKNLYFAKTMKEIGNQVNEFSGKVFTKNGKEHRDRLKKHFDRLDILSSSLEIVSKITRIQNIDAIYGLLVLSKSNIIEHAPNIPRDKIHICSIDKLSSPEELKDHLIKWTK